MMDIKIPFKIISRLKTNAPTHETGGWGRRYGDFSESSDESSGYKGVYVYVQNGLAEYVDLFKEIVRGIFKVQKGNNRPYPLMVFGFGKTDSLQHEKKPFDLGYANDIYNIGKIAETIARISGDRPVNPAIIPEFFPKVRYPYGKIKIEHDDLLVIIGRENEVYLNENLKGKIRSSFMKRILSVDIGEDNVSFKTKDKIFDYKLIKYD